MDCGTKPQSSDLRGRGSSPASLLQDFSDGMLYRHLRSGKLGSHHLQASPPLEPLQWPD